MKIIQVKYIHGKNKVLKKRRRVQALQIQALQIQASILLKFCDTYKFIIKIVSV